MYGQQQSTTVWHNNMGEMSGDNVFLSSAGSGFRSCNIGLDQGVQLGVHLQRAHRSVTLPPDNFDGLLQADLKLNWVNKSLDRT